MNNKRHYNNRLRETTHNLTRQHNNTTTTDTDQQQINNKTKMIKTMERNQEQTNKENQQEQKQETITLNYIIKTQTNNHENITLRKLKHKAQTTKYTIKNQPLPKSNGNSPELKQTRNVAESKNANKTQPPQKPNSR